jgi:membrane-bound inhibitor of C-type lysozyme
MIAFSRLGLAALAALAIVGCQQQGPTKEEIEAAKKTFDCDHAGDRILVRFDEGEARLLMPDGSRIILYQVQVASGVRYTNGIIDLRGRGFELSLQNDRQTVRMNCKQYEIPPKKQ